MPKYAELLAFMEQNFITEADGDMLHREAHALAVRRIEESIGQSDRNIRGIRETALKEIRKLYGGVLTYRKQGSSSLMP